MCLSGTIPVHIQGMYVHVCIVCVYECTCVCMYVCMYVCTYVCAYVCAYVCMYVCTCIHHTTLDSLGICLPLSDYNVAEIDYIQPL